MDTYDYRESSEIAGNVLDEVDNLSVKQRLLAHEAIQKVKAETEAERMEQGAEWFNTAILPVIKGYAEITGSVLQIERMDQKVITATLRNKCGFDISYQYRLLYIALMASVHISIELSDDELALVLAYDTGYFADYD